MRISSGTKHRSGFTLVEMVVVVGIIIVLLALAVALVPRVNDAQKSAQGGSRAQGWALIAKQYALRDKAPRGLRLIPEVGDPDGGLGHVHTLLYIERPDNFSGGTITITQPGPTPGTLLVTGTGVDFSGGFSSPGDWPVQVGDYLEYEGSPWQFQITGTPSPTTLTIADPNPASPGTLTPIGPTADYRIIRKPRPIVAEAPLLMPKDVGIDLNLSLVFQTSYGQYDILFTPSGAASSDMNPGAVKDKIILWVRDVSRDGLNADQTLVTIYTKTGLIAAHPVDLSYQTVCSTNLTTSAPPPGGWPVTIAVVNMPPLAPGVEIVFDAGGQTPEIGIVSSVSGSTVYVNPLRGAFVANHQAPFTVIVDPYSFTRDGRSSGM